MQNRMWGNEYRTTLVCVDSYQDSVFKGRLYNPCPGGSQSFSSLMGFFQAVEALLDKMHFPENFFACRSFGPPPTQDSGGEPQEGQGERRGQLATFAVRIIFRQNASWQGSVSWLEARREESFRSALELALLMDSALRGGEERPT